MPNEWLTGLSGLAAWPAAQIFLLVATRIGGAIAFVPIPGLRNAPLLARVILTVSLSLIVAPVWISGSSPAVDLAASGVSFVRIVAVEAAFGISVGVVVGWLNEAFVLSMQILGVQAGYSYTSTIDPTTQADSSTLPIMAQLTSLLLFFAVGIDRVIIEAFGKSLTTMPPGSFHFDAAVADAVIKHTSAMFSLALRLALPLVALLVLVDLALALLGRLNQQLQLLSLAFPAKMLLSLLVLASLTTVLPLLYKQAWEGAMPLIWKLTASGRH